MPGPARTMNANGGRARGAGDLGEGELVEHRRGTARPARSAAGPVTRSNPGPWRSASERRCQSSSVPIAKLSAVRVHGNRSGRSGVETPEAGRRSRLTVAAHEVPSQRSHRSPKMGDSCGLWALARPLINKAGFVGALNRRPRTAPSQQRGGLQASDGGENLVAASNGGFGVISRWAGWWGQCCR